MGTREIASALALAGFLGLLLCISFVGCEETAPGPLPYPLQVQELELIAKQAKSVPYNIPDDAQPDNKITNGIKFGTCLVCKASTTLVCAGCNHTHYCSNEHQKMDWKYHAPACPQHRKIMEDLMNQNHVHEFRPWSFESVQAEDLNSAEDWETLLPILAPKANLKSPSIFRLLTQEFSQSATIARAFKHKESQYGNHERDGPVVVHVIGSAQWEYESFMHGSYNWITAAFPETSFEFYFIGMSIAENANGLEHKHNERLRGKFIKKEFTDFLDQWKNKEKQKPADLFIAFHPGILMYPEWRKVVKAIHQNLLELTFTSYREWEQSAEIRVLDSLGFEETWESHDNPFRSLRPRQSTSIENDIFYENTKLTSIKTHNPLYPKKKMPKGRPIH